MARMARDKYGNRTSLKRVRRVGRVTRTVAHPIHDGGEVGMDAAPCAKARKVAGVT